MHRELKTYKASINNYFSFLKETVRLDDLYNKSIPLDDNQGYLLPVCRLHENDQPLIQLLSDWRAKHSDSFPTQFTVTPEGTGRWLKKNLLDVSDRILFLVLNAQGHCLGHLGFANGLNDQQELEVDNVVRGIDHCSRGIMHVAMKKLISWAEEYIAPKVISLRVFGDNSHAVSFYENLGFILDKKIPLKKEIQADFISYNSINEGEQPDRYFFYMRYVQSPVSNVQKLISTAGPSISAREVSYAADAARNGWNSQWNGYIKRMEQTFADYLGVKHALSTSSCTGALHIALAALGIGPGDEVIVPDLTWVATANAVVYVGALPVFADVDMQSWCMDPKSFEKLITPRTKAVIPVHLYGHPAPIDEIVSIARKHGLYIIEDAAPASGAEWRGQKAGTFGDFATFSFQGAKLAVTGEGGMLVTNNDELFAKAYSIWDQGREPGTFWIKQNGLKYKMSNIQAALGLGQIERVEELIQAKRRIFAWYAEFLQDLPGIQLNFEKKEAYSIYWMTSILLQSDACVSRDELISLLKTYHIDTRPVFPAISQYPHWPKIQQPQPNSLHIGNNALNLPSGVCLKKEEVKYICRALRSILTNTKVAQKEVL